MFNSVKVASLRKHIAIIFAGRGGQGVLTASSISAQAFFLSGYDVKKSDIKGIARRGGRVMSTLIAGERVYSPKIVPEMADVAVLLSNDLDLKFSVGTLIILPAEEEIVRYPKNLNVFCLGKLSTLLDIPLENWERAIRKRFKGSVSDMNLLAFHNGRKSAGVIEVS